MSGPVNASAENTVWIEKTSERTQYARDAGGVRQLLSPSSSTSGGDIYKNMRDIRPGNVVLHFTRNRAFTDLSVAVSHYFERVEGGRKFYVVHLANSVRLDPPLTREEIFRSPFDERLVTLVDQGLTGRFYTRRLTIAQGRYLTKAPAQLLEVLEDVYLSAHSRSLIALIHRLGEMSHSISYKP
jgi:hypothetical protein